MRTSETGIEEVSVVEVPQITTSVGDLAVVDGVEPIPFSPKRVFYLYDVPSGSDRGAHAHKECHQFLVAVSGAFSVEVTDGLNTGVFDLNRPTFGLYVPPGIWAAEGSFSGGAICLVLASHEYDELDYIRDWDQFLRFKELSFN